MIRTARSALACLLMVAADAASGTSQEWKLALQPVESPAAPGSAQPQLSSSRHGVLLSWIEQQGRTASLRFAERTPQGWTEPRTVASGTDWFVNWADVPSVIRLDDGTLAAHWLQKSGADTYAYDVRLSMSTDGGTSWKPSFLPHHDGTKTEHGFASLFEMAGAKLGLVWLDGRAMKADPNGGGHGGHGDMALRFATFDGTWSQTADLRIDPRVCECCPTAVAVTDDGPVVAYRDRGADELRDISITRFVGGKWTNPRSLHTDGWRVPACPVNGPALSARGRDVAAAWFTARDDQPKALLAFSTDAGASFGAPTRLDDTATLGRVDVELLPDGSALGAYIEFADKRATFRVRRVQRDGTRSAPITIAALAGNRTSGYPRMARHGNEIIFAWVERDEAGKSQVRTATASLV